MRRTQIGALVAALSLGGATALFAADAGGDPAMLVAQQKFVAAYRTCNTADMQKLVTDDMQFIHAGGMTQDMQSFIAGVGTCGLAQLDIAVTKVRMYGDAAVVQGNFTYKMKQGPGGELIISELFVKKNGAWLFASHQSTVPAAPAPAKK